MSDPTRLTRERRAELKALAETAVPEVWAQFTDISPKSILALVEEVEAWRAAALDVDLLLHDLNVASPTGFAALLRRAEE